MNVDDGEISYQGVIFASLQFDGIHVVSGSLDTSIRVWDVETGNCIHTLTGHQSLTSGMELKDNILVSGNADSTVKIWDIKTGQCLQTLQGKRKRKRLSEEYKKRERETRTSNTDLKYRDRYYWCGSNHLMQRK